MYSEEQIKLARVAVAYFMYQDATLDLPTALDLIRLDLIDYSAGNIVLPLAPYISLLYERGIKTDIFYLILSTSKELIDSLVITCKTLAALQFNDNEIFAILMSQNYAKLLDIPFIAEEMPTIFRHISIKLSKYHMSLDDAVTEVLPSLADQYLTKVTHSMVNFLLSPEARLQLYISARSRKIITYPTLMTNFSNDEAYRENARFHLEHQASGYMEADRQLTAMNFSLREINSILKRHTNASISSLSTEIKTLPLRSDVMLQVLFTPAENMMTADLPMSKLAMSNELDSFYPLRWVNVGLGTFLLGMIAYQYLPPKVFKAPISFLNYAGSKLLGFLPKPSQTNLLPQPSISPDRSKRGVLFS